MKRIQLTHGSARVEDHCSPETIKMLDEMSKIAYNHNFKKMKTQRDLFDETTELHKEFYSSIGANYDEQADELNLCVERGIIGFMKDKIRKEKERLYTEIMEEINEHKSYRKVNGKMKYIIVAQGFRNTIDEIFEKTDV